MGSLAPLVPTHVSSTLAEDTTGDLAPPGARVEAKGAIVVAWRAGRHREVWARLERPRRQDAPMMIAVSYFLFIVRGFFLVRALPTLLTCFFAPCSQARCTAPCTLPIPRLLPSSPPSFFFFTASLGSPSNFNGPS